LRNDGKTLLVVGDSKKSKLIDISSNRVIKEIEEHVNTIKILYYIIFYIYLYFIINNK